MSVIRIEKWETSDGRLFSTEKEAVAYEALSAIQDWYEDDNELLGSSRQTHAVDWERLIQWVETNAAQVKKILEIVCKK